VIGHPASSAWGFRVLGTVSLVLSVILLGGFAMGGGSRCAVSVQECEEISGAFGIAALFFFALTALSIWKVLKPRTSRDRKNAHEAVE
jgi:membrane protein implicated in regulation of membrane protease activity